MRLNVHANARAFKSRRRPGGRGCIVLPPADPRGVIDHGLPGVVRGINHRARRSALANLSSASEALNLSAGQRAARSGAARLVRRTHFFSPPAFRRSFEKRMDRKRAIPRLDSNPRWLTALIVQCPDVRSYRLTLVSMSNRCCWRGLIASTSTRHTDTVFHDHGSALSPSLLHSFLVAAFPHEAAKPCGAGFDTGEAAFSR